MPVAVAQEARTGHFNPSLLVYFPLPVLGLFPFDALVAFPAVSTDRPDAFVLCLAAPQADTASAGLAGPGPPLPAQVVPGGQPSVPWGRGRHGCPQTCL